MNKIKEDAINLHRALRGKIEIHNRVAIDAGFGEEKGTIGLTYIIRRSFAGRFTASVQYNCYQCSQHYRRIMHDICLSIRKLAIIDRDKRSSPREIPTTDYPRKHLLCIICTTQKWD